MPRIKVTGYLNTEDLPDEHVDLDHHFGLSDEGFQAVTDELGLEDTDFELQREG